MRTTLIINDSLLASAKKLAAERQCSLSAVVNDALRCALNRPTANENAPPFQMPRFRGVGPVTDTLPAELEDLSSDDELETFHL